LQNPTGPVETEVKIPMPDGAAAARRLIESHGFLETEPRTLQVDQVYDFPDRTLRQSGKLLRVRSESSSEPGAILTFKGPAVSGSPHKSREELETSAASRATLEQILERLGFVPSFRYEKYRTTFRAGVEGEAGLIALDETPIGVFLELEGPGYWIDRTAVEFGFMPKDYVTTSYAALYRDYLTANPGPSDMTFLECSQRPAGK
jgi:adenylate cyclase, class 2